MIGFRRARGRRASLTTALLLESLALATFAPLATRAQGLAGPRVELLGGLTVATLVGSDAVGSAQRAGFVGGIGVRTPVARVFALEADLLFSEQGSGSPAGSAFSGGQRLDYLALPVLARFELPGGTGTVAPFVVLGPQVAVELACSVSTIGGASSSASCNAAGIPHNTFDVGVTFGGGAIYRLDRRHTLSLSARYTLGVLDVAPQTDAQNRVISVLAGIGLF